MRHFLRKSEILHHRQAIDLLFREGKPYHDSGCTVLTRHREPGTEQVLRVLFVAPKRNLRQAVQRNAAKRFLREAYRRCKHVLLESLTEHNRALDVACIYTGKSLDGLPKIAQSLPKLLNKIAAEVHTPEK